MLGLSISTKSILALLLSLHGLEQATASPVIAARDSLTTVVNLGNSTGSPQHLASGILYGVPNKLNQISANFYKQMGFNYLRAGGAQLPAPARGWIWGKKEYTNRMASVINNYKTARQYNANFIFLIHDLWGADGTQNSSAPYPGDNGSWTSWDNYLTAVIKDMRSNSMIQGVVIDIWNEPDLGTVFWGRSQDQYLQMWGRTWHRLQAEFGTTVLTSGPSAAYSPSAGNTWWTNFASFIANNASIPDQWSWHMEGGGGDMLSTQAGLFDVLGQYNLPMKPININEYATFNEQVPSGAAWWIAQLERINANGLRGNWLSGYALHDFMASLLGKPHANTPTYSPTQKGYWPNGEYQVYKYYNLNMTGTRLGSVPSGDLQIDTYVTRGTDNIVRVLTGVRVNTGTWYIQLNNLTALGLPDSGSLNIHTWGFPAAADAHYGEVDGPNDLGYYGHGYSGNTVTFPVFQNDRTTSYAFEFAAA